MAVSIRLGKGNPNLGAWQLERARVEDAFIERDADSLSLRRLADLPGLVNASPERWPKSELSVSPDDIRCDKASPTPGERIGGQPTIHNHGSEEATAMISLVIDAFSSSDLGLPGGTAGGFPHHKIPPGGQVVVAWDGVWPQGNGWSVSVGVALYTPHAFGGYRVPMKERNTQDNRAYLRVPAPR